MEICSILKKYENDLSKKAQNYIKIFEHQSTTEEKKIKLIRGILYDTITEFKAEKNTSASEVISSCIENLIQQWPTIKDTTSLQLDRLINEAIKRALSVEEDLNHVADLANLLSSLVSIPGGCSSQIPDWFCYKLQQLPKKNIECDCLKICQPMKLFEVELLAIKIRYISSSHEKVDLLKSVITAAGSHLNGTNFCKHHVKNAIENCLYFICNNIFKGKKISSHQRTFLKLIENIILCDGNQNQDNETLTEYIQGINSAISTILGLKPNKSSGENFACFYVAAFNEYLSTLISTVCKINGSLTAVLKSIRKFSSLASFENDTEVLKKIITFYYYVFKNASSQDMNTILEDLIYLAENNQASLSLKTPQNEDFVIFFYEMAVRICLVAINSKGQNDFDSSIEKLSQKGFDSLIDADFLEHSKSTALLTNLAVVLVKAKRKLSEHTSAMKIVETTLSKAPFDIAKPLLQQWVKAKLREVEGSKRKEAEIIMKRTIAENLKGKISDNFLTELLFLELELYEQAKASQISQLAVINYILSCCSLMDKNIVPKLSCKRIKLQYKLGESKISSEDLDNVYSVCSGDSINWEYVVQIKLIDFLQMWCENMNADPTLKIDLLMLDEIVQYCENSSKNDLSCGEETCKALLETASLLKLFQRPVLKIRLLLTLRKLLESETEKADVKTMFLWYTCFTLCEITNTYHSLKQCNSAEKYSNLACDAFERYESFVKEQNISDPDSKLRNLLFIKTQIELAKVKISQGKVSDAQKIIYTCKSHDFLQLEKLQRSNTALFCSVLTLQADADVISDSSEPRLYRLSNASKRIASLKASVLPELHMVQKSESHFKGVKFGINNAQGTCFEIQMQLHLLKYFFKNLHDLGESYLLMGDYKMAGAYTEKGLLHSKYLKLKHWYTAFCLLKLQISALQHDEENFPQLCKYFCQVVECKCYSKSGCLDDSVLRCDSFDEEDDNVNEEREAVVEIMGSTDDDAMQVPTQALDVECYPMHSASPVVQRRKKLKAMVLPRVFLNRKKCSCKVALDWISVKMQLRYTDILAENCVRTDSIDEGMNIAKKMLEIASSFDELLVMDGEKVSGKDFLFCDIVASNIRLSCLFLSKNNKKQAQKACQTALQTLESLNFISCRTHLLKSQIHFMFSRLYPISRSKIKSADSDNLNALIDGISKCKISSSVVEVHTPVMSRTQKKIISTTKTKPTQRVTKIRKTKTSGIRTKKDASGEFKIFSEESKNENTLPVPKYIPDRTPSPLERNSVYDFDSSDGEKITRTKKPLKSSENLMMARKAATRRHRKQFGAIYTDEDKERVRGRVTKSDRVGGRRLKVVEVANDADSSTETNVSESTSKRLTHLTDALLSAHAAGDFLTMKLSAQAISLYYSAVSSSTENTMKAAAFHLFSIGITTRMIMQIYAKNIMNMKGSGDACNYLHNFTECIDPNKAISNCIKNTAVILSEITYLMPQDWTICAMSLSNESETKLLLTRLHHGTEPFHVQIDGKHLEDILDKFSDLMIRNTAALKSRDKSYWWTQRRNMDAELKTIITQLGDKGLGCFVGALLGQVKDEIIASKLNNAVHDIVEEFKITEDKTEEIVVLLNSWQHLSVEQKLESILHLFANEVTNEIISAISTMVERFSVSLNLTAQDRHHVILICDKDVQLLPWESISQLNGKSVTRLPSTDLLKMQLNLLKSAEKSVAKEGVNLKDVSYILNPNGDLVKSEQRYKDWFEGMKSWKGIVSRAPMQSEWISSITEFDLFIYCGHGSGTKYVSRNDFRNIKTRAAALLMGCGSAKLDQAGIFEPTGIIVHYLMTGSPCVLGCLWKVTDKDIDTYLCKLLETWANGKKESMPRCTSKAQSAMKMPHINGSACVIYGLPIHCQVTIAKFLEDIPKI